MRECFPCAQWKKSDASLDNSNGMLVLSDSVFLVIAFSFFLCV